MPPYLAEIPYGFKNLWIIRISTYDAENSTFSAALVQGVILNGSDVAVQQMTALYDYNRDVASIHVEAGNARLFVTLTGYAEGVFSFRELVRSDGGSSGYILPIASETALGGVKVGDNLSIAANGMLNAVVPDVSDFATVAQLAAEATARADADELLDVTINAVGGEVDALRTEVEGIVIPDVSGLASEAALSAEALARETADLTLQGNIDAIVVPDISGLATTAALQAEAAALQASIDAVVSFPEAPTDGQRYARQNAAWVAISGGGEGGEDGATFVPSVSADGDISWSNNKGLPNPQAVNIKGPPGNDGAPGADGIDGEQGERGVPGSQGEPGADGTVFIPSVSADGVISWTNGGGLPNPSPVSTKGPQGEPGNDGAKGEPGERGLQGIQGIQGVQGAQGERGQNGSPGDRGAPGPQGEPGTAGADGAAGANGRDGADGTPGEDATINGVNALTITAGDNITLSQADATLTISASSGGEGGNVTAHMFTELDDIQVCAGGIINGGSGWNSYTFPREFDGVPSISAQLVGTEGFILFNNITAKGFQYQVRIPGVNVSATAGTYYTALGTAANSLHSAQTLVNGVSGAFTSATTASALEISYQAIYDGGVN